VRKFLTSVGHGLASIILATALVAAGVVVCQADVLALIEPATGRLVSSATQVTDAPSDSFTILINKNLHTDPTIYGRWLDLLSGRDTGLITEDATASVLAGDESGLMMAQSLASRLPARQLTVCEENPVIGISKAREGVFDILVMSDEMAESVRADELYRFDWVGVVRR
jgi:hypothetical protein